MKILITGGTGKIGKHVIKQCKKNSFDVTLLIRRKNGQKLSNIKVIVGDIERIDTFINNIGKFDIVIHMAALTHSRKKKKYLDVNVNGTKNIIDMCKIKNIKRLVFISSRAIGISCGDYGYSKYLAEKLVSSSNLDWTILRISEVCGASDEEAISNILKKIKNNKIVFIPGDGRYEIMPILVEDVVWSILNTITNKKTYYKKYLIAGSERYDLIDFVSMLIDIYKSKSKIVKIPIPALNVICNVLSIVPLTEKIIVKDQIARLLCKKCNDISFAKTDIGFEPKSII